jgi:hypothetical protein
MELAAFAAGAELAERPALEAERGVAMRPADSRQKQSARHHFFVVIFKRIL